MSKLPIEFTSDDFYNLDFNNRHRAVEHANYKLREYFEKCPVVYGEKMQATQTFIWVKPEATIPARSPHLLGATHRAYLVGVEEIEKEPCLHEDVDTGRRGTQVIGWCKDCGAELVATWSSKEPA
jgi:threonine dehydratase